jgi:hypothetical protein
VLALPNTNPRLVLPNTILHRLPLPNTRRRLVLPNTAPVLALPDTAPRLPLPNTFLRRLMLPNTAPLLPLNTGHHIPKNFGLRTRLEPSASWIAIIAKSGRAS